MPNLTPLQSAFVSGELSPELLARPNLVLAENNIYQRGVRELSNFWTDPRGPIRSRDGFRYIGAVLADDAPPSFVCEAGVYYDAGSGLAADNGYNLDYSPDMNYIAASVNPRNGQSGGRTTVVFDEATGNVVRSYTECTRSGHKMVLSTGGVRTLFVRYFWQCGATSARSIYLYDMADSWNQLGFVQLGAGGLANTRIVGDTAQNVLFSGDDTGDRYYLVSKLDWSGTGVTNALTPSGWEPRLAASFNVDPELAPNAFLLCMWNGTQFGFVQWDGLTAIPTPTVLLDPVGGDNFISWMSNPIVLPFPGGQHVWWMFDTGQAGKIRQYLVRTDLDGDNQILVPMYDDLIQATTGSGYDRIHYDPLRNSLFYMYGDEIWRYEIATGEYFQCLPAYEDGLIVSPPQRSQSLLRVNDYHWNVVYETGAGSDDWGVEKIEARF